MLFSNWYDFSLQKVAVAVAIELFYYLTREIDIRQIDISRL
jgi:hypothetical protein